MGIPCTAMRRMWDACYAVLFAREGRSRAQRGVRTYWNERGPRCPKRPHGHKAGRAFCKRGRSRRWIERRPGDASSISNRRKASMRVVTKARRARSRSTLCIGEAQRSCCHIGAPHGQWTRSLRDKALFRRSREESTSRHECERLTLYSPRAVRAPSLT